MPALKVVGAWIAMGALLVLGPSCKKKASAAQCEELLDRYTQLAVKERGGDAGAEAVAAERQEARGHDAFKNCTSEVQLDEHACAMKATTSAAMLKCLD